MHGAGQTCLDDRWRGKVGNVKDRTRTVVSGHRFTQHIVGQSGHHSYVWVGSSCQQCDFEVSRVVVAGADDRDGLGELGVIELVAGQLEDGDAGAVQLLDNGVR